MGYNSHAIANYFIERANSEGQGVTPMKVQKLVYFAYGWHLAIYDSPLIYEEMQAWDYGPVFPELYRAIKHYGSGKVVGFAGVVYDMHPFNKTCPHVAIDDGNVRSLLDRIWKVYGGYTGVKLSNMTHLAGSPWSQIKKQHGGQIPQCVPIPDSSIKAYFEELGQQSE